MKPLILITNDDGVHAKGISELAQIASEFGEVVVMAPDRNASGMSHSLTTDRPLRVTPVSQTGNVNIFACSGTPVDCVKVASMHFCSRRADLVLSGINHGSNASVNVLYSGTMGAVIEASNNGIPAVGFSLLDHDPDAEFSSCRPFIRTIIANVLKEGLPHRVSLNVNFPPHTADGYRGMRICRESEALWTDSFEQRIDPHGNAYYWLTGNFECTDKEPDTDQWALEHGYVSVVPTTADFTAAASIPQLTRQFSL